VLRTEAFPQATSALLKSPAVTWEMGILIRLHQHSANNLYVISCKAITRCCKVILSELILFPILQSYFQTMIMLMHAGHSRFTVSTVVVGLGMQIKLHIRSVTFSKVIRILCCYLRLAGTELWTMYSVA